MGTKNTRAKMTCMAHIAKQCGNEPQPGYMLEFKYFSGNNPSNHASQAHRWKTVRIGITSSESYIEDGMSYVNIGTTPLEISWYDNPITIERIECCVFEGVLMADLRPRHQHHSSVTRVRIMLLRIQKT